MAIFLTLLIVCYAYAAPSGNIDLTKAATAIGPQEANQETDLKTDASTCMYILTLTKLSYVVYTEITLGR